MKMQTYLMRELFKHFEDLPESDLVTREIGAKAYDVLKQAILQTASETMLLFDFTDVLVMDSSFAGPSLLRLMREMIQGQYGDRYMVLTKATASTKENVDLTIRGHGLKMAIPVVEDDSKLRLLGDLEPSLSKTFEFLDQRKTVTARELADTERIGINAASNRLKKLYDLRLVTRTEEMTTEGRQHNYQSLLA